MAQTDGQLSWRSGDSSDNGLSISKNRANEDMQSLTRSGLFISIGLLLGILDDYWGAAGKELGF